MDGRAFNLERFYALVGATGKERAPLRQDLVRGLKEYYELLYGYDRYGAETIFLLEERMGYPRVFGFGVQRILRDRRVSTATKLACASQAVEAVRYGEDAGIPYALLGAVEYIAAHGRLSTGDLRYVLLALAPEYGPFRGVEREEIVSLFGRLLQEEGMPPEERAFWAHSLLARHQDGPATPELIELLVASRHLQPELRQELCLAWIYGRQPRLEVPVPLPGAGARDIFVAEHLAFWVAHMPSWPSPTMVRAGLAALPRFGADPADLAETYITYRDTWAEQIHAAVADIVTRHHATMSPRSLRSVIEQGIEIPGSATARRRFYQLGAELLGSQYLQRASHDAAGSVRQWASRQLQRQS